MPRTPRLAFAAKGAVLWVLLSTLLGLVPVWLRPDHVTFSIPWLAAGLGLVGAGSHVVVALYFSERFSLAGTAAKVWCLAVSCTAVTSFAVLGGVESFVASVSVALAFAVLSLLVVYLLRRHNAV
jgi:hypothetical protein